jgi:hypothetical protein
MNYQEGVSLLNLVATLLLSLTAFYTILMIVHVMELVVCTDIGVWRNRMGAPRKHGHNNRITGQSPTYRSWYAMKTRCTNPNNPDWKWYGARGIKVCDRWLDFVNFLDDMGERPEGKTLDRYPNKDGDYEPNNCRWASNDEQIKNRNKRTYWDTSHQDPITGIFTKRQETQ